MNIQETKYKVLIVDDSHFMRRIITDILESDPRLKVVGTAFNGEMSIAKVKELNPDVITLDFEMPGMNGLEALKELKQITSAPIIMFSSHTKKGAEFTFNALEAGAFDFVQKPEESENSKIEDIKKELIFKVITAAHSSRKSLLSAGKLIQSVKISGATRLKDKLIVIGASTGGPPALKNLLAALPADFPAKILIVQHMPGNFTESFSKRLDFYSRISVSEAKENDVLSSGKAYLAPGGFHMTLDNTGKIRLNQDPLVCGVRPAVDVTIKSVANIFNKNLICVILTGMGHDGTEGVKYAKQKGAYCIVEHESTCVVYGMPKSIVDAGQADVVAPLDKIPEEIMKALYV